MAQSTLSWMIQVLWNQYPLGSQLSMSLVTRQLALHKLYLDEVSPGLLAPFRSFITLYTIDRNQFWKTHHDLLRNTVKELPLAGSLVFIIVYVPLLLIFIVIISLILVFVLLVALLLLSLVAAAYLLFFVGAPSVFVVWFCLYRYPIFDILHPRVHAWMLRHNAHVYRKLSDEESTSHVIRLVRLKPGLKDQELECDLVAEKLSDASFEALSYVWGTSLFPLRITVNGYTYYVTGNLHAALRHLRQPASERLLWIDALSINQADTLEKNLQVQRMRDIFSRASRVLIWLGKEHSATPAALQLAQDIASTAGDLQKERWTQALSSKSWPAEKREWNRILGHPWWTRTWTVQEAVAASSLVVMRGKQQIHWETLSDFLKSPASHQDPDFNANNMECFKYIENLRIEFASVDGTHKTLFNLAFHFRHQSATLGADKLFGLQGLLPSHTPIRLMPDYSKPSEEVFIDFAIACIEKRKDLLVIALAPGAEVHGVSWCRDWAFPYEGLMPVDWFSMSPPAHKSYSADGGHSAAYMADASCRALTVRGLTLDTIGRCMPVERQTREYGVNWYTVLHSWQRSIGGPWDGESQRSFNRTITAAYWPEDSVSWADRLNLDSHPLDPKAENQNFAGYVSRACLNRTFFVTKGGRFGLGSSTVRTGDLVTVLLGSRVPFILRRCGKKDLKRRHLEQSDRVTQNYFKLIGEAYVDGIMYYDGDIHADVLNGTIQLSDYTLL